MSVLVWASSSLGFWKRPSFWTGLLAIVVYWDSQALNGGYVYDDAGSVIKNVVVNGQVPWREAFVRDYWGQEMKEIGSHKSFRPITTLTLKANYVHATTYKDANEKHPPTFEFHLVNVLLHGMVTALITEATNFVFDDDDNNNNDNTLLSLLVGFLFGFHPVHAEVVSNITSRGELLMSLFNLLAFLSFASSIKKSCGWVRTILGVYLFPWIGMTLSLFSKEQGATTLITCVGYDFLKHHGNALQLWKDLFPTTTNTTTTVTKSTDADDSSKEQQQQQQQERKSQAWRFVIRTGILAVQTLVICAWRYILNGESSPDFIEAQNPAGFAADRFTRAFSISWVYCLYIRDAIYPTLLSPDWSGKSIDLITSLSDYRAIIVITLWYFSAMSFWTLFVGTGQSSEKTEDDKKKSKKSNNNNTPWLDDATLRLVNMAVWAFIFSPFLLSSNILIVVGLMKADRVIYLPLFGFCLLEAIVMRQFLQGIMKHRLTFPPPFNTRRQQDYWSAYFFFLMQLIMFAKLTHIRNLCWSDSLLLWGSAYAVNPRSHHTMYNYGYELSIKQRYTEAEAVLRPIGNPRVDGPTNTFVYAMVLYNLKRCPEAEILLDEAFAVIEEKRQTGGTRNTAQALGRTESNLMVAKAHCTQDFAEKGRILYDAVQKDPTNEYAVSTATQFMEKMQEYEKIKEQYASSSSSGTMN